MAGVRVQFGRPRGAQQLSAIIGAQLSKELAQAVVERVQDRVDHPAADALRAEGVNQHAAIVTSPRGGPGIIRPVVARALRFQGRGGIVFASKVNGAGLLPLIVAEGERLSQRDADQAIQRINI